jgi:hypothetical protein
MIPSQRIFGVRCRLWDENDLSCLSAMLKVEGAVRIDKLNCSRNRGV